ncbi:regulatory protein [Rutstroemia sp. NJR-2017a WRK4]|nr:regulatory protein [Rutstroemia sp. NJR-2017a WRK4]
MLRIWPEARVDGQRIQGKGDGKQHKTNRQAHFTSEGILMTFYFTDKSQAHTPGSSTQGSSRSLPIATSETTLLMHFLDVVFPLQYPLYKPPITQGGRGWLLSLLLSTKPLYHAALGLSAYHKGTILLETSRAQCGKTNISDQEKHFAICLIEFQQAIKDVNHWVSEIAVCPVNSLGIMACVVQLIFFEVWHLIPRLDVFGVLFSVQNGAWQIHLRAATDIFSQGFQDQAANVGLHVSMDALSDTSPVACEMTESGDAITFIFLAGVVAWLDIVSCVSTGQSPRLLHLHTSALSSVSHVQLENIMGCNNWAMIQIGRVAALHEKKVEGIRNNHFICESFGKEVDEIRHTIQHGLTEQFLAKVQISSSDAHAKHDPMSPQNIITRLYSLAAYVYLEVVVSGFQVVETDSDLRAIIGEAMMLLQNMPRGDIWRGIVCPLYIFGTVTSCEHRELFRHIFSSEPIKDPTIHHRATILPLLEDIWRLRHETLNNVSWEDSLRLSKEKILLL